VTKAAAAAGETKHIPKRSNAAIEAISCPR